MFVSQSIPRKIVDLDNVIKDILFNLDMLTYFKSTRVSNKDFCEKRRIIDNYIDNIDNMDYKSELHKGKKRLWCAIRDYLKHPIFNKYFIDALGNAGGVSCSDAKLFSRGHEELKKTLKILELPGDVWNNFSSIRVDIFGKYVSGAIPSDMPIFIRNIYDCFDNYKMDFYPEQLDVTFDFAPRMCNKRGMCELCFFGGGIEKSCHKKRGIICSILMYSCGYKVYCDPSGCKIKNIKTEKYCGRYSAANNHSKSWSR